LVGYDNCYDITVFERGVLWIYNMIRIGSMMAWSERIPGVYTSFL